MCRLSSVLMAVLSASWPALGNEAAPTFQYTYYLFEALAERKGCGTSRSSNSSCGTDQLPARRRGEGHEKQDRIGRRPAVCPDPPTGALDNPAISGIVFRAGAIARHRMPVTRAIHSRKGPKT